jgi:predicted oxidoreductase
MNPTPFSPIIAGAMTWGSWGRQCNTKEMIELLHCCLDSNITSFDHADIYGSYTTEAEFGAAFKESKIDRQAVQLISKCSIQLESENRKGTIIKHYEYSKNYIISSVEQSLKNLQTEYLDLVLLHRPSPLMRVGEIAEAIEQLTSEGKILDFGVSNFTPAQSELIQTKTKINYNQIEFSVSHMEPMLDGSLDYMQAKGIKPMAWSPLGGVFKQTDPQSLRLNEVATQLAEKYAVSLDIILLAWILKHPAGVLPVCGTSDTKRIANLMKAIEVELELQEWFALWEANRGLPVP